MDKKKVRLERPKELLRLHESGQLQNLIFSNEKLFQIKQFVNNPNDRVYLPKTSAENVHPRLAPRIQAPSMVMVWAAITADGRSQLVFINRGFKIKYYRENVFKRVLKPWAANISAAEHGHLKGLKRRLLASFLPYHGHQNLPISIRWTFASGAFWRVRFSLKNAKN